MANPHTKTYVFPVETIPAGLMRITLVVTIMADGTSTSQNAWEENLKLISIGEYSIEADMDNLFLAPVTMEFIISDLNRLLHDYLFNDPDADKAFNLKFEIDRGSGYEVEFEGYMIMSQVTWEDGLNTLQASFAPRSNDLNSCMLWDDSTALNPLGYSPGDIILVQTLIEDIFKYIDPATSTEFWHDWVFRGSQYDSTPVLQHTTGQLDELYVNVNPYFFEQGYTNLGDVLRGLALELGSYAGWQSSKKAFFRKLFAVQSNSPVTLPRHAFIKRSKSFQELKILAKTNVTHQRLYASGGNLYYNASVNPFGNGLGSLPSYTAGGSTFDNDLIFELKTTQHHASPEPMEYKIYGTWFLPEPGGTGKYYPIDEALPGEDIVPTGYPGVYQNQYRMYAQLLSDYYYYHRCRIESSSLIEIEATGTEYDIVKDITYSGRNYHIIALTKNYIEDKSTFRVIPI